MKRLLLIATLFASLPLLQGCAVVALGAAGVTAKAASDPRTVGTQVDDTTLKSRVYQALKDQRTSTNNSRVVVTSYNGAILLTGQVANSQQSQEVARIAKQVDGVEHVYNQLVTAPVVGATTIMADSLITSNVKAQLIGTSQTRARNIKVVTENGVVFLMGIVSQAEGETAARVASKVSGVTTVVKIFTYDNK